MQILTKLRKSAKESLHLFAVPSITVNQMLGAKSIEINRHQFIVGCHETTAVEGSTPWLKEYKLSFKQTWTIWNEISVCFMYWFKECHSHLIGPCRSVFVSSGAKAPIMFFNQYSNFCSSAGCKNFFLQQADIKAKGWKHTCKSSNVHAKYLSYLCSDPLFHHNHKISHLSHLISSLCYTSYVHRAPSC